jgi:crotonobetainyl-CoA:carnitine CoA-transferase CaiB-like acyl-CoA transferase
VKYADVVVENYSSRVFENFGLNYERFAANKPDIIMLSLQGYGDSGPYRDGPAFGSTIEAMSGFKSLLGYGNGVPIYTGACIADPLSGLYGLFAVINALFYRQKTGKGQHINVSMHEAMSSITEEALLEYDIHRRAPEQWGSGHPYFAPYGSYRCAGDDSWIAISVTSDQEWASLCAVIDIPQLRDICFSTVTQRQQNRDHLDLLVEQWTLKHNAVEAMEILQQAGVPAGAFHNGKDILNNTHLIARDFFWNVVCPDTGTYPQVGPIVRFSETPATLRLSPPGLGEHNEYILGSILGMSKDDIISLQQEGIIGNIPRYKGLLD